MNYKREEIKSMKKRNDAQFNHLIKDVARSFMQKKDTFEDAIKEVYAERFFMDDNLDHLFKTEVEVEINTAALRETIDQRF